MNSDLLFLSYILDENTPTYGNRNKFVLNPNASIVKGDVANDSSISTTVHMGTHLDLPFHFHQDGQTIEAFDADHWHFNKILFIDLQPQEIVIKNELIDLLIPVKDKDSYELLIVKTGACHYRDEDKFWNANPGFAPEISDYLKENFKNIRVLGFDSISVSSFSERMIGREAHKRFLEPSHPIMLLEDMDLRALDNTLSIKSMIISPLRIGKCDGLPCTVFATLKRHDD